MSFSKGDAVQYSMPRSQSGTVPVNAKLISTCMYFYHYRFYFIEAFYVSLNFKRDVTVENVKQWYHSLVGYLLVAASLHSMDSSPRALNIADGKSGLGRALVANVLFVDAEFSLLHLKSISIDDVLYQLWFGRTSRSQR